MSFENKNSAASPDSWVDLYGNYLYRFAMSRVRNPETAENLVQETFLAALKAKDNFRNASSQKTWLVGILKHKIIDHIRAKYKKSAELSFSDDQTAINEAFTANGEPKIQPLSWQPNSRELLLNKEFWQIFERCLKKLPQKTADIFSMREIDNLETKEICKLLHISPTNLWVSLHRARLQLRDCLEKNWFNNP